MTIAELKKLRPGTAVLWTGVGAPARGRVRVAEPKNTRSARWIEWEDGARTENYDNSSLVHIKVGRTPGRNRQLDDAARKLVKSLRLAEDDRAVVDLQAFEQLKAALGGEGK